MRDPPGVPPGIRAYGFDAGGIPCGGGGGIEPIENPPGILTGMDGGPDEAACGAISCADW